MTAIRSGGAIWLANRRIDRAQFADLEGNPISITEAAKKYELTYQAITKWIERGYIKDLGFAPGYKRRRLVNEADVAYAHALLKFKQPISGQSVFN